eukprot:1771088-Pleurochrysis_carterae.AAC.1
MHLAEASDAWRRRFNDLWDEMRRSVTADAAAVTLRCKLTRLAAAQKDAVAPTLLEAADKEKEKEKDREEDKEENREEDKEENREEDNVEEEDDATKGERQVKVLSSLPLPSFSSSSSLLEAATLSLAAARVSSEALLPSTSIVKAASLDLIRHVRRAQEQNASDTHLLVAQGRPDPCSTRPARYAFVPDELRPAVSLFASLPLGNALSVGEMPARHAFMQVCAARFLVQIAVADVEDRSAFLGGVHSVAKQSKRAALHGSDQPYNGFGLFSGWYEGHGMARAGISEEYTRVAAADTVGSVVVCKFTDYTVAVTTLWRAGHCRRSLLLSPNATCTRKQSCCFSGRS